MTQSPTFNATAALREGWALTIKQLWFFVGVMVLFYVTSSAAGFLDALVADEREDGFFVAIFFVVTVAGWILQAVMSLGLINITLRLLAGQSAEFRDLFSQYRKLFTFAAASFLYGAMVLLGLLLFIIPGIYWAVKYQFFVYRIVEAGDGVVAALRNSGRLTVGMKWRLVGFSLVLVLINILGALFFGIGLLVSVPVTMLARTSVYRQLSTSSTPVSPVVPPVPAAASPVA